uniref:Uncharacterized protein n=1 Tax=Timema monikensis TaxID=170555 RepID=A0A7R9E6K9_9NEOP|nr:unnamed protein product [Timema monikensis]
MLLILVLFQEKPSSPNGGYKCQTGSKLPSQLTSDSQHLVILPQLAAMSAYTLQMSNQTRRLDLAVALIEAFSSAVYCSLSKQTISTILLPGLRYLEPISGQSLSAHHDTVMAMIKGAESRVEPQQPIESQDKVLNLCSPLAYNIVVCPLVLYSSEIWSTAKRGWERLRALSRKFVRKIWGARSRAAACGGGLEAQDRMWWSNVVAIGCGGGLEAQDRMWWSNDVARDLEQLRVEGDWRLRTECDGVTLWLEI